VWCLALLAALWCTPMPIAARLAASVLAGALYGAGYRQLALTDRRAVRRLYWASDGLWQLQDSQLQRHYVCLAAPARALGPLLWLRLRNADRQFSVLIDDRHAEPGAFCTLKGRLKLNPYRQEPSH
jgi:hypothetical protein